MRGPARLVRWTAGVVALLVLAACGEEPTPPRLTGFEPASPSVAANETVDIKVTYEAGDFKLERFAWTAEAGEIEGDGKPEITYRAPAAAGDYKLSVTATAGQDGQPDLSLDTMVKVLPAQEPAVVQAPTGGAATAQSAGQKAAAAARAAVQGAGSQAVEAGKEVAEQAEQGVESATRQVTEVGKEAATSAGAASPATEKAAAARPGSAAPAASSDKPATTEPAAERGVDAIVDRKKLRAVVEDDFAPFSYTDDTGHRVGFDVDLIREFARRWLGDPDAVTFLAVTPEQRIAALDEDNADLVAAALTKTPDREQAIDFSETYFKDGQRLLVAEDAEVAGPCDLAGKKVAVLAGTTSLDNIKAEAARCGFAIEDDLVVFDRQDQAVAALRAGEVAAFTSDGIALEHLAEGQPLKVVGNHFSEEPYGIGVPKGDQRLRRLVDLTLDEMGKDGTYAAIYRKWFGDALSPYPLEASPGLAEDAQLMALATTDQPPLFEPVAGKDVPADYVVQPGDTLSTIAGKIYGDVAPGAWRAIYQANKAAIGDDPNRIKVGMRLTLPSSL